MNEILKFDRAYYEKYNTSRINIENGILVLKESRYVRRVLAHTLKTKLTLH